MNHPIIKGKSICFREIRSNYTPFRLCTVVSGFTTPNTRERFFSSPNFRFLEIVHPERPVSGEGGWASLSLVYFSTGRRSLQLGG